MINLISHLGAKVLGIDIPKNYKIYQRFRCKNLSSQESKLTFPVFIRITALVNTEQLVGAYLYIYSYTDQQILL